MLRSSLSIGDKIEVRLLNRKGIPLKNIEPYSSQLLDFFSNEPEKIISIAMPIKAGQTIILEPGIHYNLCFFSDKGLYQCNCRMLKSYRENNTLIAAVLITTELEKFQRRQYYRLEVVHEIEFCSITDEELTAIIKAEEEKKNDNLKQESDAIEKADIINTLVQLSKDWNKAYVVDLSGGGVRFNSKVLLEPRERILIKIEFTLKDIAKSYIFGAKTIQSTRLENHTNQYVTRAEFTNIKKGEREDLIKFIFEQERQRRKNNKY